MEIRDLLHGSITLSSEEARIVDSRFFQRLRQIKQLGFAEHSFPSATHNRFIHSLGALETASRAFDQIFRHQPRLIRLRAALRLAALLHDVGHGPLSHTTEFAMPMRSALRLPHVLGPDRQATHEDYTLKILLDSSLSPLLERVGAVHGFGPRHIAALIDPSIAIEDDFFFDRDPESGARVDYRPILEQLISSELDADRMDYLRRDSLMAGVSYGHFDFDWMVASLTSHVSSGQALLALEHRALYSFEDFLISRFHMFLMVYFHYKSVVYDSMLARFFAEAAGEYQIPSDIEAYGAVDDAHLHNALARSRSEWARRIIERRPLRMLIELHSGIPATENAQRAQEELLAQVRTSLDVAGTPYVLKTSTGELSKYHHRSLVSGGASAVTHARPHPLLVRYDNHHSEPSFIGIEQCTDLFEKYEAKRSITRLYVTPEDYARLKQTGRGAALNFERGVEAGR